MYPGYFQYWKSWDFLSAMLFKSFKLVRRETVQYLLTSYHIACADENNATTEV
jgi:hypothetical protein